MANPDITKIPAPRTPLVDEASGDMTPAWYRFFYNIFGITGGGGDGGIAVNRGGTGQTSYTDGQLLIGNSVGNTLNKNTLTPGTGIGVTNGHGPLDNQKIRAPVSKGKDKTETGKDAIPLNPHRVGLGCSGILPGGCPCVGCITFFRNNRRQLILQTLPSAQITHAEDHDGKQSDHDDKKLEYFIVNRRRQSAKVGISQYDGSRKDKAEVEIPSQHLFHQNGQGVHGNSGSKDGHKCKKDGV